MVTPFNGLLCNEATRISVSPIDKEFHKERPFSFTSREETLAAPHPSFGQLPRDVLRKYRYSMGCRLVGRDGPETEFDSAKLQLHRVGERNGLEIKGSQQSIDLFSLLQARTDLGQPLLQF